MIESKLKENLALVKIDEVQFSTKFLNPLIFSIFPIMDTSIVFNRSSGLFRSDIPVMTSRYITWLE